MEHDFPETLQPCVTDRVVKGCLEGLEEIYSGIDSLYESARRAYGFGCKGCAESCCFTRFDHYTIIEEAYRLSGFDRLPSERKRHFVRRASSVVEAYESAGDEARTAGPLYEKGLCVLYAYRPMICRMHGVPYLTFRQDGAVEYGAGCSRFMSDHAGKDFVFYPFNRTMFYHEVARIERDMRAATGVSTVQRKTIADMLLRRAEG